jgi:hypothetical protein
MHCPVVIAAAQDEALRCVLRQGPGETSEADSDSVLRLVSPSYGDQNKCTERSCMDTETQQKMGTGKFVFIVLVISSQATEHGKLGKCARGQSSRHVLGVIEPHGTSGLTAE